jgi:hypothetical protein
MSDVIEFKSMYTFDFAISRIPWYFEAVEKDFEKNHRVIKDLEVKQFEVLIATHPKANIPNEFGNIVKYYRNINKGLGYGESKLIELSNKKVSEKFLYPHYETLSFKMNAGHFYDIPVDVYFWIIKKTYEQPSLA